MCFEPKKTSFILEGHFYIWLVPKKFAVGGIRTSYLDKLVSQWYTESSFVNSPGKNQIFCLLAPLSQLPFYFEGNVHTLRNTICNTFCCHPIIFLESDHPVICINNSLHDSSSFLTEDIREILLKHHLFSWEI